MGGKAEGESRGVRDGEEGETEDRKDVQRDSYEERRVSRLRRGDDEPARAWLARCLGGVEGGLIKAGLLADAGAGLVRRGSMRPAFRSTELLDAGDDGLERCASRRLRLLVEVDASSSACSATLRVSGRGGSERSAEEGFGWRQATHRWRAPCA